MFQRSQCFFLLTTLVLESVVATSLAAHIINKLVPPCTIPGCTTITLHCKASGKEVEWLDPNNNVITTGRLYTIPYTGLVTISYPQVTDSGRYTCREKDNHSDYDDVELIVTQFANFIFGSNFIYEEKVALRYTDVFINCSVEPIDAYTSWNFENIRISDFNNKNKYSQNISGLTIYNVTEEDQGNYICFLHTTDLSNATIQLNVIWPPESSLPQNRIVQVNVMEEVKLNCTTSASPDPLYHWSFPDSCSSCSNTSNNYFSFTADITSGGEYICVAENSHGKLSLTFVVIISYNLTLIDESRIAIRDNDHNLVFDCSANASIQQNNNIAWALVLHDLVFVITDTIKYSATQTELVIHNAARNDNGSYACYANDTFKVYKVIHIAAVEWPPEILYENNHITKEVFIRKNVILNCTVSASPDPVYSWSFPESCLSCPNTSNDSVLIFTAEISNGGVYICLAENSHGNSSISFIVNTIISHPTFIFSNDTVLFKHKDALFESNVFINCSVDYGTEFDNITIWTLDGELVWINETFKYNVNASGLTVYNVTAEDQGNYTCHVHRLTATTFLDVVWPPKFSLEQNQIVRINVSEQVILNCTVSASPDPVYNWSFPNSCSSCPRNSTDNLMIFSTNFTDIGGHLFRCNATNNYGSITITFIVYVLSKPIMLHSQKSIIKSISNINVMLTCGVKYAYPTANITWNIKTESFAVYHMLEENSTGNYILHNNGSLEIYHHFIHAEDHVMAMCLATNKYGSAQTVFHIWDPERVETFKLYVKVCNCQNLKHESDKLFTELREWFSTVCNCDGLHNLHEPQLECVNETTGSLTSRVHHEGNNAAKTLIDLATVNMQKQDPPSARLPSGWMVCLNPYCKWECDDSSSGGGEYSQQDIVLYVKSRTNCQNYISNTNNLLQSSLQEWLKSLCRCDLQMISFQPTCYDKSTVMIMMTMTIEHHSNGSIEGVIERKINESGSSIFYMHSGLAICVNPDCQLKDGVNNTSTTTEKSFDENSVSQIVGPVVGVLCGITVLLLIIITLTWVINKRKSVKRVVSKVPTNGNKDQVYDELCTITMKSMNPSIMNITSNVTSDDITSDAKKIEPAGYHSSVPLHESCSTTSIAKLHHSNDTEDVRSIKDADCHFEMEKSSRQDKKASNQNEEIAD